MGGKTLLSCGLYCVKKRDLNTIINDTGPAESSKIAKMVLHSHNHYHLCTISPFCAKSVILPTS